MTPGPSQRASGGRQSLGPEERLRRRQDYLRAYRAGRRRGGRFSTLFFVANETGIARLGITASRKVGKSVVRQRLKRRVREIYRRWERRSDLPAFDLVVNLKPPAAEGEFADLRRELEHQLRTLLPGGAPESHRGRRHPTERDPIVSRLTILLLDAYKRWLSPWLPRSCRFAPTCSEYARLAVVEHGVLVGGGKTVARLLRCQPLTPGGIDLP